jgi:(p)ppGpp synthase/HD superfamily hydrolase
MLLDKLEKKLENILKILSKKDAEKISEAYNFAKKSHDGQFRKS